MRRISGTITLRLIVLLMVITASFYHAGAQPAVNDIIPDFQSYRNTHYQEKVYLHSDRSFYLTGETIWFKVYCMDGTFHKPSDLSKIIYVQLIRDSLEDVAHSIVSVDNGSGSGSIYLPTTLRSGNYTLRAYTRWMKNFDEAFYFHSDITIVNPFRPLGMTEPGHSKAVHMDFFPEGGTLIAGSDRRVAFEIRDNNGNGLDYQGWLTDEGGNKIVSFNTGHAGLGSFVFSPGQSTYTAHISGPDGRQHDFSFPEVSEKGYSLHVRPGSHKIIVQIDATGIKEPKAKLFIHTRNIIYSFTNLRFNGEKAVFSIEKAKLPAGITHITLFNATGQPVCERLICIRPENLLQVKVTPDHKLYGQRKRVNLAIKTLLSGKTTAANLSVSVCRYDEHYADNRDNIVSYTWLTSDLAGRIEDPRYYLKNTREADKALDDLMLTHGWRRFRWQEILRHHPEAATEIPEFRYMIVSGTLKDKATGNPVRDTLVYLSNPGKYLQTYISRSDSLGRIYFEIKNFYGNRQIIVQTEHQPDGGYDLHLDPVFSTQPLTTPSRPLHISRDWELIIKTLSLSMQISNAYREAHPAPAGVSKDTSLFYGRPDERYYLDDYTRFPVMEEVMREYIHGVLVRRHHGHFRFMVLDPENDRIFSKPPFLLFDGVPVFDTDRIMDYDPRKVERIDVITSKYFIGKKTCHGIVNYTTYSGNLEGFDISDADLVMFIDGLQAKRTFYSPEYPGKETSGSRIPDYRNLLFWKPGLMVDESGMAKIEFYTSDEPGVYKVVVEGITPDGIPGHEVTFIEVKGDPEK